MVAIPSRHRSLVLLTIVIVVQVLFLAVQIQHADKEGENHSLMRSWSVGLISPFERAGAWGVGKVRGTWRHYFALSDAARENERLKQENDALKLENTQLRSKVSEADRLAGLLNFRDPLRHGELCGLGVGRIRQADRHEHRETMRVLLGGKSDADQLDPVHQLLA